MALWLVRAGERGEYENKFLEENKIYLTWDHLNRDLRPLTSRDELRTVLQEVYPGIGIGRLINNSGQIFAFSQRMSIGDWIVVPSKHRPVIHFAEITGAYSYESNAEDPFFHHRDIEWIAKDIPRSNFDQDLLYSFGAFMTICKIQRNDAESRIRSMAASGWTRSSSVLQPRIDTDNDEPRETAADLEQIARDQIARLITANFMGHRMANLVDAILQVQGYTTFVSPPGPDKGVDILAAAGNLGFGEPRICVQVKSGDSPVDRPTLDQLQGAMQNVQAQQGLLVSWGGFKNSVEREVVSKFFRIRLWDQDDLIDQILDNYDRLPPEIRTELPLKRIWTVAATDA
ncbi:MAG: restriction endonuclease [Desulfuromonadales bacterium]